MAAETQTQEASVANEQSESRSPVIWGARHGDRISFSVRYGKLWAHFYKMGMVDGKPKPVHVYSMPLKPDQAEIGSGILREGARYALVQDEEYREQRRAQQGSARFLGA